LKNKTLSDRQIEIITNYLLLSKGDKIKDKTFIAFTSEIDDIIDLLNK
jgi:hypothetical protein